MRSGHVDRILLVLVGHLREIHDGLLSGEAIDLLPEFCFSCFCKVYLFHAKLRSAVIQVSHEVLHIRIRNIAEYRVITSPGPRAFSLARKIGPDGHG